MNKRNNGQIDRHTDGMKSEGQTYRWTAIQMDRHTDGHTYRWTYLHRDLQTYR